MMARLIALWFTVGISGLFSFIHFVHAAVHFRNWRYEFEGDPTLPTGTVLFSPSGWIYFFPALFVVIAGWLTWKVREKGEVIWCFIVMCFGTMLLFSGLFHLAMDLLEALIEEIRD